MAVETESDKEMNLVAHLAELRNRLIVTAVFFIVFFVGAFIYVKEIYSFFEKDMDFVLNVTSPAEIIWVYLTMAGLAALVGTLPIRSEEHTSELQSRGHLVCRLLLE